MKIFIYILFKCLFFHLSKISSIFPGPKFALNSREYREIEWKLREKGKLDMGLIPINKVLSFLCKSFCYRVNCDLGASF